MSLNFEEILSKINSESRYIILPLDLVFNKNDYDVIIFGTPVWAGTFTPPLRTFVKENDLSDKNIVIFACSSGGKATNAINKLKDEIGINSDVLSLELVDPKNKYNEKIEKQIDDFIEEIKKVYN